MFSFNLIILFFAKIMHEEFILSFVHVFSSFSVILYQNTFS